MSYSAKSTAQVLCESNDKSATQLLKLDTVTQRVDHVAVYALDFNADQVVSVSHDQLNYVSFIIVKGTQPFDVSLKKDSSTNVDLYTGLKSTFYMRVFPNPASISHIKVLAGPTNGRFELMIGVTIPPPP